MTKRLASEVAGTYQLLVCQAVEAAQLSLPVTQAACCQVITFEPTKLFGDGAPAPCQLAALWPISMMSISPLRGQVWALVPSSQAAGHKPVWTFGAAMRISIIPYWTCSLFFVS